MSQTCTIYHQPLKPIKSIRLKNQFRSLDDDEVDFLDSVLESTRAKDAAIAKETTEQLDLFRSQQEEAERAVISEDNALGLPALEEQWLVTGKKRKKQREHDGEKALKLRRTSSTATDHVDSRIVNMPARNHIQNRPAREHNNNEKERKESLQSQDATRRVASQQDVPVPPIAQRNPPALPGLGLGVYSSDED